MRNQIIFTALALIALMLGDLMIAPRVAAQTPINTSPASAIYLENQWHHIPANTTVYFLFDYNGDRSVFELVLADGNTKKLQFNLYTPDQASGRADSRQPFGRGSAPMVNCDAGRCPSNHILWKGATPVGGTYLVEVINPNPLGMPYFLGIVGGAITLRVPPPQPPFQLQPYIAPTITATPTITTSAILTPTITATVTPTATAIITATSAITPSDSFALGSQAQTIPAFSDLWVSFYYPGDRGKIEISIPGGADLRLISLIFMQDAPNAETRFIGEASAQARDLVWTSEWSTPGMCYVQMINNNPVPQVFEVIVRGNKIK